MPRHHIRYDSSMKAEHGWSSLYNKWRVIKKELSPDFAMFEDFYKWSVSKGWTPGAHLRRRDDSKPYSPDNCEWYSNDLKETNMSNEDREAFVEAWNKSVNRIRRHFGMRPLPGTE